MQSATVRKGAQRTFYDILGVQTTATAKQIKIAYLKKAKELHPDLHAAKKEQKLKEQQEKQLKMESQSASSGILGGLMGNKNNAAATEADVEFNHEEEFKLVTEAYETLSSIEERKKYDAKVLNLFDGAEYYFGKKGGGKPGYEQSASLWEVRNNKKSGHRVPQADAAFIKNFKEEIDYRRRMRYTSDPEDLERLQKMSRHFLNSSCLSYDQFTAPKIKGWSVISIQDARSRQIRFRQFLLFSAVFFASFFGLILFHVKMKEMYGMPEQKIQTLLEEYYKERALKSGEVWDVSVMAKGLPDHKL